MHYVNKMIASQIYIFHISGKQDFSLETKKMEIKMLFSFFCIIIIIIIIPQIKCGSISINNVLILYL